MAIGKSDRDPDEYLASLTGDVRYDMQSLDKAIRQTMESDDRVIFEGTFWGGSDQILIGYGPMTYRSKAGKTGDWFAVGLGLQKNYTSIYIMAVEGKEYVVEKYGKRVGKVRVGKSNISFTSLADINIDELMKLVAMAKAQRDEKDGVL